MFTTTPFFRELNKAQMNLIVMDSDQGKGISGPKKQFREEAKVLIWPMCGFVASVRHNSVP